MRRNRRAKEISQFLFLHPLVKFISIRLLDSNISKTR